MKYRCFWGFLLVATVLAQSFDPRAIEQANLGVTLSRKQDYRGAVQAYQRALAIDSKLPNLYLNLGLAYFKAGHFAKALDAFKHEPASNRTATLIGMSHFGLGEYQQAAAVLQPLSAAEPDNSELGYLLAKCYLWAGNRSQASEMFRKLLEHDPDSAPVHMLMAEALDADDREKEATGEFEAAVKSAPAQPEAHFGLGYLYWKQRRYADAEREFNAELANNPQHALSLAYIGDILLRGDHREQALTTLKKAEGLNTSLHVVHQDLGILYQGSKQTDLALKEFQEAVRTSPANYDAHYRLARIYQQLGRRTEAANEFSIVQRLHAQQREEPLMRISGPR